MEKEKTYEGMMDEWIDTYIYCLKFEQQIQEQEIPEEEINEYLQEKAKLIVCLGNLFAIKCMSEKQKYDLEFVQKLFDDFKIQMAARDTALTEFDGQYVQEMIEEMAKDFEEQPEEPAEE